MKSKTQILLLVLSLGFSYLKAQTPIWSSFVDSEATLSSPHVHDINLDGTLDIVLGAGKDGNASNSGIIAINGSTGETLLNAPSRNEVFGSAVFQDITNDGIKDVFITGREAQFYALDGADGSLIWDFYPYGTNPADSGWFNFYNPQFIDDIDGDTYPDFIVTNGGDHSIPEWETNRPPGHIMVLSSMTGDILANVVVPDSAETYCSPIVVDLQNNGNKWVLFGTGGENLGGSFYACPLSSILSNNTNGSIVLASDSLKGFIAPASVSYNSSSGVNDIIIISFDGKLHKINGSDFSTYWTFQHPETESSAEPVLGNFTGDLTPDVFLTLFKGTAPSYSEFYQVMLDGSNGEMKFIDSLGELNYSSGNAIDLNNDGRDEAISSITYNTNGYYEHRIEQIDFVSNTTSPLTSLEAGVNLASTPLFIDIDNDQNIELIYAYKHDSLNPGSTNGVYINRVNLSSISPNAGIAWGSYLGSNFDGKYFYYPMNCGMLSVISNVNISNPSCNNESDGSIIPITHGTTGPYIYNWSNGSIDTALINVTAGFYWVRITNSMGCYEERQVMLADPYIISFGAISSPTCVGDNDGNATLSSSGCPCMFSGCTFLWENGGTGKPNDSLTAGWNSVTITHTDGCVVTDSVEVPEPAPVVNGFSVQNITCYGESDGNISLELDSMYMPEVVWFNGTDSSFIDGLSEGAYSVVVSDSRGCMDFLTIELTSPDELIVETEHTPWLCSGAEDGVISLAVSGGTPAYSYYVNGALHQDTVITNLSEGTYTLIVSDSNNCSLEEQLSIESLDPIEGSYDVILASNMTSFDGIIISSIEGGLPPYSYQWSNGATDPVIVYLSTGWYSLELTDSNGCVFTDSVFVGTLSLSELSNSDNLAYPNPTSGKLFFKSHAVDIEVYSREGKRVLIKSEGDNIDLSSLACGLYYIRLKTGGKAHRFTAARISN